MKVSKTGDGELLIYKKVGTKWVNIIIDEDGDIETNTINSQSKVNEGYPFPTTIDDTIKFWDEHPSKVYYGIEVQHKSNPTWYEWGKMYMSIEIAKEALSAIERDNTRLVNEGSKWRIFKVVREGEI
jgi:hypothetical protein